MTTMQLHLRKGEISLHCTRCRRVFEIRRSGPLLVQLRATTRHVCVGRVDAEPTSLFR